MNTSEQNQTGAVLSLEKNVFADGEDIMVTVSGVEKCRFVLYAEGEEPGKGPDEIYWYLIGDDVKPGKAFSVRKTRTTGRIEYGSLPAGKYTLMLLDGKTTLTSETITILPPEYAAGFDTEAHEKPQPPKQVLPDLPKTAEGLAEGNVTVTLKENTPWANHLYLYWTDENGKEPLAGYAYLARAHTAGGTTVIPLPRFLTIPAQAKGILACAVNHWGKSDYAFAPLPENSTALKPGELKMSFQVVSDLHLEPDPNSEYTSHLGVMIRDVMSFCPESSGIMVAGDLTNGGEEPQYQIFRSIVDSIEGAPDFHIVIGNHDTHRNFEQQLELFNKYIGNDRLYFDRWIGGYHFIFFAQEQSGCQSPIPEKQLDWLREKLAENASPDRPIFLFCHESIVNTVAGSTPEEGWWGIVNEKEVGGLFAQYPQAILFNGHSHWEVSSKNEMYPADERMCNAFNTASVGYLWSGYNIVPGEYLDGAEGLHVEVYDNMTLVRGRDFVRGLWSASAQYVVFPKNK